MRFRASIVLLIRHTAYSIEHTSYSRECSLTLPPCYRDAAVRLHVVLGFMPPMVHRVQQHPTDVSVQAILPKVRPAMVHPYPAYTPHIQPILSYYWPNPIFIKLIDMSYFRGGGGCSPFVPLLMWSLACLCVSDGAKDGVKRCSGGFSADHAGTHRLQRHPRGGAAAAAGGDYIFVL